MTQNIRAINQFLNKALTDEALTTMALEVFPTAYNNMAVGMTRAHKQRLIIEYCDKHEAFNTLISYVRQHNPTQYDRFLPDLQPFLPATAELDRQIEQLQATYQQYEQLIAREKNKARQTQLHQQAEEIRQEMKGLEAERATLLKPAPRLQTPATHKPAFLYNVPYGLEMNPIGREDEQDILDSWLNGDGNRPFFVMVGLGGQGKSALTWNWLERQRTAGNLPPLTIWWSFYTHDGTARNLFQTILEHFNDDPSQYQGLRALRDRAQEQLTHHPTLLVLDGAERILKAYAGSNAAYVGDGDVGRTDDSRRCTDPLLGEWLRWLALPRLHQCQTLMSTRLFPADVMGRAGLPLMGVQRHDLTGLTAQTAQQLFAQHKHTLTLTQVQQLCEPVGYHPLSVAILLGALQRFPVRDMSEVLQLAEPDLLGNRQRILQKAYDGLPPTAQHRLSQLAAFRDGIVWGVLEDFWLYGSKVKNKYLQRAYRFVAKKVVNGVTRIAQVQSELELLEKRGLLECTHITLDGKLVQRYDLHPIVRRFAYDQLSNPTDTHQQLISYFEAVPKPQHIQTLKELHPQLELYHHLIKAKQYETAFTLYQDNLKDRLYYQLGAYQQEIALLQALFPDGVEQPLHWANDQQESYVLNDLAGVNYMLGDGQQAIAFLQRLNLISKNNDNKTNLAIGLGNWADAQTDVGQWAEASHHYQERIRLSQEMGDKYSEANGHRGFGLLCTLQGQGDDSHHHLDVALEIFREQDHIQMQGVTWAYRAWGALLAGQAEEGAEAGAEALRLADETAKRQYPYERDYVRVYWLQGWAAVLAKDWRVAQGALDEALRRCRRINLVETEHCILLAQAWLARGQGQASLSGQKAREAFAIATRCGYKPALADIHNHLALLALDTGDEAQAREQATRGYQTAWLDGPPHAYHWALVEAERILGLLGDSPPDMGA